MDELKENNSHRKLRGWRLYGYCFGIFGMMLPFSLVNGYVFQFYVYTIGLDALIVSIGLFLGMVLENESWFLCGESFHIVLFASFYGFHLGSALKICQFFSLL